MARMGTRSRGFTLVEVMVVLLVVGILSTSFTLGLDALRGREVDQSLARLRLVLEACAERAQVRGRPIALEFLADGYRFYNFSTDGRWRLFSDPPVFVERQLPEELRWGKLWVNGREQSDGRLVFGSQPARFELVVQGPGGPVRFIGSETGEVRRIGPGGNANS